MYKILVSGMAYDGGKSGVSVYMNKVIAELAANHQLTLVMLKKDVAVFPVRHQNLSFIAISDRLSNPLVNMIWHLLLFPLLISRGKYDFVFLPAANRRACLWYNLFTVGTVHDLSQYHIEAKYDWFRMNYIKRVLPRCVQRMQQVVAVSNSTKNDLIKYWKIKAEKITVCYNGYDNKRFMANDQVAENTTLPYGLRTKGYILYISRIEHPGKNHLNLIKAYELLSVELRNKYDLALGGSFWRGSEPVQEYAASSPAAKTIKFTGFVDNANLPALYHQAALYVFPSLFEGFGLSLVEAMACGTPIACSNNSSLGEVGGSAAVQFPPDDIPGIKRCLEQVLTDETIRNQMIAAGFEQLHKFNWAEHAGKIIEIYEKNI